MNLVLPRLYVILDASLVTIPLNDCALGLADAGVRLLQYRNKVAPARQQLSDSKELAELLKPRQVSFFVNDRPDIACLAGASGVHVGQEDLDVEQARQLVGADRWVGVSTHTFAQFARAANSSADYIAVGPIFSTTSKANPDPVVGTDLLRRVRSLTKKPIVAIGGITLDRAAEVIAAGADCIAVVSDILRAGDPPNRARQFINLLADAKSAAAV
jgi:thiamine-phosphate pyrophosphorylase